MATPPTLPSLCALLDEGVRERIAPAMSAVVLARGRLAHQSVHGSARLSPTPRPLRDESVFDLASLTKVMCTTTLAALFYETGDLKLDLPVRSYLPFFASAPVGEVTPRQLLAHRAGLAWWRPYHEEIAKDPAARGDPTKARALAMRLLAEEAATSAPKTPMVYSDLGFILLGWLLEAIGADPLPALFAERIARPLDLTQSFFPSARQDTRAADFVATGEPLDNEELCGVVHDENARALGGACGHAGLFANARDVARLGEAWLEALTTRRDELLCPKTAALFAKIDPGGRALGWDTASPHDSACGQKLGRGPRGVIGHLGFTGTSLWLDLDARIVAVLLTNRTYFGSDNQAIKRLRQRFHDAIGETIE